MSLKTIIDDTNSNRTTAEIVSAITDELRECEERAQSRDRHFERAAIARVRVIHKMLASDKQSNSYGLKEDDRGRLRKQSGSILEQHNKENPSMLKSITRELFSPETFIRGMTSNDPVVGTLIRGFNGYKKNKAVKEKEDKAATKKKKSTVKKDARVERVDNPSAHEIKNPEGEAEKDPVVEQLKLIGRNIKDLSGDVRRLKFNNEFMAPNRVEGNHGRVNGEDRHHVKNVKSLHDEITHNDHKTYSKPVNFKHDVASSEYGHLQAPTGGVDGASKSIQSVLSNAHSITNNITTSHGFNDVYKILNDSATSLLSNTINDNAKALRIAVPKRSELNAITSSVDHNYGNAGARTNIVNSADEKTSNLNVTHNTGSNSNSNSNTNTVNNSGSQHVANSNGSNSSKNAKTKNAFKNIGGDTTSKTSIGSNSNSNTNTVNNSGSQHVANSNGSNSLIKLSNYRNKKVGLNNINNQNSEFDDSNVQYNASAKNSIDRMRERIATINSAVDSVTLRNSNSNSVSDSDSSGIVSDNNTNNMSSSSSSNGSHSLLSTIGRIIRPAKVKNTGSDKTNTYNVGGASGSVNGDNVVDDGATTTNNISHDHSSISNRNNQKNNAITKSKLGGVKGNIIRIAAGMLFGGSSKSSNNEANNVSTSTVMSPKNGITMSKREGDSSALDTLNDINANASMVANDNRHTDNTQSKSSSTSTSTHRLPIMTSASRVRDNNGMSSVVTAIERGFARTNASLSNIERLTSITVRNQMLDRRERFNRITDSRRDRHFYAGNASSQMSSSGSDDEGGSSLMSALERGIDMMGGGSAGGKGKGKGKSGKASKAGKTTSKTSRAASKANNVRRGLGATEAVSGGSKAIKEAGALSKVGALGKIGGKFAKGVPLVGALLDVGLGATEGFDSEDSTRRYGDDSILSKISSTVDHAKSNALFNTVSADTFTNMGRSGSSTFLHMLGYDTDERGMPSGGFGDWKGFGKGGGDTKYLEHEDDVYKKTINWLGGFGYRSTSEINKENNANVSNNNNNDSNRSVTSSDKEIQKINSERSSSMLSGGLNSIPPDPRTVLPGTGINAFNSDSSNDSVNDILNHIVKNESNGNNYDSRGNVLTSRKGARGKMQVMPATAKQPGYGITPAKDDSVEEYERVGKELILSLYKKYKGDPEKTMAAYNWGPTAVDRVVKQSETTGQDWRASLPEETRNYISYDKMTGTSTINDNLKAFRDERHVKESQKMKENDVSNTSSNDTHDIEQNLHNQILERRESENAMTINNTDTDASKTSQTEMGNGNIVPRGQTINTGITMTPVSQYYTQSHRQGDLNANAKSNANIITNGSNINSNGISDNRQYDRITSSGKTLQQVHSGNDDVYNNGPISSNYDYAYANTNANGDDRLTTSDHRNSSIVSGGDSNTSKINSTSMNVGVGGDSVTNTTGKDVNNTSTKTNANSNGANTSNSNASTTTNGNVIKLQLSDSESPHLQLVDGGIDSTKTINTTTPVTSGNREHRGRDRVANNLSSNSTNSRYSSNDNSNTNNNSTENNPMVVNAPTNNTNHNNTTVQTGPLIPFNSEPTIRRIFNDTARKSIFR